MKNVFTVMRKIEYREEEGSTYDHVLEDICDNEELASKVAERLAQQHELESSDSEEDWEKHTFYVEFKTVRTCL